MFGSIFLCYIIGSGIFITAILLCLRHYGDVAEQRRKEDLICSFVDDALAKNELYPLIDHQYGPEIYGECGSAHRAAIELGLKDTSEAYGMINIELTKRGLRSTKSP